MSTANTGSTAMTRPKLVRSLRGRLVAPAAILGLVLVAAACGGSSDGAADSSTSTSSTASSDAAASDGETTDSSSGDAASVSVTVGDTTWGFEVESGLAVQCLVFAGESTFGSGVGIDSPSRLSFELNDNAERDDSYIVIAADDGSYEWVAGSNDGRTFDEGDSQVDSADFDGDSVSGTATFIDAASDERTPVEGSFNITCP